MSNEKALTIADIKKLTVEAVSSEVTEMLSQGQLVLPQNYSEVNALKSAWLMLQEIVDKDKKPALTVCTQNSVRLALMDMVIQGLSPNKKQCYFIVYGNKIQMFRSYFGTIAILKRTTGIKDVYAQVIREKDIFEFSTIHGVKYVVKHVQTLESLDSPIIGAYATFIREDNSKESEIMTIAQIKKSWSKSKTVGFNNSTHKEFEEEMCKRTVLNRGAKLYLNTSDDSDLLSEAINREYDNEAEIVNETLPDPNSIVLDTDDYAVIEEIPFSEEPQPIEEANNDQIEIGDLE
jgi:recombination protein RecT